MKCNCIEDIENRLKDNGGYKKPIVGVDLVDVGIILEKKLDTRTISHFEVTLEGQKKTKKISMMHNFCPFCGKNQRPEKE